ncbi:MAG: HEPN family nuclease [Eubacteriales bacterium]|nr:HEPN family nuclease [Eubacteriales bacterium]
MSGYIFQEFVRDFSSRTRQNMNVIDSIYTEHSDEPEKKVYEVTQVINSLFGMIIVPFEKYKDQNKINEKDYSDDQNYIRIKELIRDLERNKFLRSTYPWDRNGIGVFSFIGHLRNALAHSGNGRLNFYPVNNKKDNIKAVYFMDRYEDDLGQISYFCCKLSIKRIQGLCEQIPSLYEVIEKDISEKERAIIFKEHLNQISQLDSFLEGDDATKMDSVFK